MSAYQPGWLCCLNLQLMAWACSEELAHSVVRHSEERAQLYHQRYYGQIILPVWAA
jgi:hypothetical protein